MKKTIRQKDGVSMKGILVLREHKAGTVDFLKPFLESLNRIKKQYFENPAYRNDAVLQKINNLQHYIDGILERSTVGKAETTNLIMTAANLGRDLIVQRLLGINTYSLNITYGEIGTGTTTPTSTDSALSIPVARAAASSGVLSDIGYNTAQIQFFYPDSSLTNSVFSEFGTFVDGSGTIGSGQMFNHALFASAYTKSAGTDITVQIQFLFS